jgi:hypothetical protein
MTTTSDALHAPTGTSASRSWWSRATATAFGVLAGTVAAAGTLAVVVAGFTLSFDAIRKVAIAAYIRPDWAWLMPVSIDGAMAVATVTAVVMSKLDRSAKYPWFVVFVGAAISIGCNATHAYLEGGEVQLPGLVAACVSAIPALQLALAVHLLVLLALALAGKFAAASAAPTSAPVVGVVPAQVPPSTSAPTSGAASGRTSGGTAGTLPAEAWTEVPPEADPEAAPEVDGGSRAAVRAEARRRTTGTQSRKKAVRRTPEETRRLHAELAERFPEATQAQLAAKLNISDRALRNALATAR